MRNISQRQNYQLDPTEFQSRGKLIQSQSRAAQRNNVQILLSCEKSAVCFLHWLGWLEQMYDFQIQIMFLLKWTVNLQDLLLQT